MMKPQRGLTLLEVMVALVILSLVALGYLQLFHGSHRLVGAAREWSQAVEYAQDAMERVKLGGPNVLGMPAESWPMLIRADLGFPIVTTTPKRMRSHKSCGSSMWSTCRRCSNCWAMPRM